MAVMRPRETFVMPGTSAMRPVLRFGLSYMTSRTVENLAENAHEPIIAKLYGEWLTGGARHPVFERCALSRFATGALHREEMIIG